VSSPQSGAISLAGLKVANFRSAFSRRGGPLLCRRPKQPCIKGALPNNRETRGLSGAASLACCSNPFDRGPYCAPRCRGSTMMRAEAIMA
jgi:hypothetical protein